MVNSSSLLKVTAATCCMLLINACSFNPFLTPQENHLTGNLGAAGAGAAVGAGSMALLGAEKNAVIFAGLTGAALGYYVSTLRFAAGGIIQAGGQVYTLGEYAGIEIPTDKLFEDNSALLLPLAEPILASAYAVLLRYPNHNILISGNTSGFGPSRYEQQLSEERARQVSAYFWSRGLDGFQERSLSTRRFLYVGYGNYFPVANNIRNSGIRENSRIQITIYPSRARLEGQERFKVFKNVGVLDSEDSCKTSEPEDFNKEFPAEAPNAIPENPNYPCVTDYNKIFAP